MTDSSLKKKLDRFYREYDFAGRIAHDPIVFPRRFKGRNDREVAGFLATSFAYGRVELFQSVVERLLSKMGKSPYDFLQAFDPKKHGKLFKGIKYRFNENADIICLLFALHTVLKRYATLEGLFMNYYRSNHETIGPALEGFVDEILQVDTSVAYGENVKPAGFTQFFPSPRNGSACKRMNLFLRWMVRDKDIDFGLWKRLPKNKLVIPLDTHIARISRCLGLTKRKTQDWQMAVEITGRLKRFDAEDPLKYDFALCHHGISGLCRGEKEEGRCSTCVYRE